MDFNVQIDISNWQNVIQERLNEIIVKRELDSDALQLRANKTRTSTETPKSYSVYIVDDDGKKETTKSVIRIEPNFTKRGEYFIAYLNDEKKQYITVLDLVETKQTKSDEKSQTTRLIIPNNEALLLQIIDDVTNHELDVYKSAGTMFGCCSSFMECSDKKACLYPHKFYTSRCWYRMNLESGKIFYGKNKNI